MKHSSKKGNLKIVEHQSEEQKKEEQKAKVMDVFEKHREERESASLDSNHRRAILYEAIERLDQTLAEATFQNVGGLIYFSVDETEGLNVEQYIEKLSPGMKTPDQRIYDVLVKAQVPGNLDLQDLDSNYQCLKSECIEIGYKIGVLLGARLAGAPPERIRLMVEYLADTLR